MRVFVTMFMFLSAQHSAEISTLLFTESQIMALFDCKILDGHRLEETAAIARRMTNALMFIRVIIIMPNFYLCAYIIIGVSSVADLAG